MARSYRAPCSAENHITVDVTDSNVASHRHEIQIYRLWGNDLPRDHSSKLIGSISCELHHILAAVLLNLNRIVFDLHLNGRFRPCGVDMQVSDGSSHDESCTLRKWTLCKNRKTTSQHEKQG